MLPACLDARALSGAIADFACNRMDRRLAQMDIQIDHLIARTKLGGDRDLRDQTGRHQCAIEIGHVLLAIRVTGRKTTDHRDMTRIKWCVGIDDDLADPPEAAGRDRHVERCAVLLMLDDQNWIAHFGKRIASLEQPAAQRSGRGVDRVGISPVARLHREQSPDVSHAGPVAGKAIDIECAYPIGIAWICGEDRGNLAHLPAGPEVEACPAIMNSPSHGADRRAKSRRSGHAAGSARCWRGHAGPRAGRKEIEAGNECGVRRIAEALKIV